MPFMADYYYLNAENKPAGPHGLEQLQEFRKSGIISGETLVAEAGTQTWIRFSELDSPSSVPVPAAKSGKLALASLICGCLSFCCGLLTGIPAVITGIMALAQKGSSAAQNRTFAVAGIILGCCSLFFTAILAALALPAIGQAMAKAKLMKEMNDARQIHVALVRYADEHGGSFPERMEDAFIQDTAHAGTTAVLLYKPGTQIPRWNYTSGLTTASPHPTVLFESAEEFKTGSRKGKILVSVNGQVDFSGNPDYKHY
jgi:hypothetical protein